MLYPRRLLKYILFRLPVAWRKTVKVFIDLCIIPTAIVLAFWLRFEWVIEAQYVHSLLIFMAQALVLSTVFFHVFGAYSEMWVYWSFRDLKRLMIIHTAVVGTIFLVDTVLHWYALPRSIYVLYWGLAAGLLTTFRMTARIVMMTPAGAENQQKQILVVGAGESAEMLARQILTHPDFHSKVVGFLDDDPRKIKRTIHGLKVFGSIDMLQHVVLEKEVDEIVIAIPSATSKQMQRIVRLCEEAKRPFKTVPGLEDLVSGEVSYRDVRQVKIDDLLGREQYDMDHERVHQLISHEVVMVTGAAGSIGSELCRQIQRFNPKLIVALDKDENRLFYLNNELKHVTHIHPVVMQLQNEAKLRHVFETLHPKIIFHAAAYKHVPCMEWYPDEAILNNLETTMLLADLAHEYQVKKFIQISTDKAVYPSNMMGVSKRLCELYIKHFKEMDRKGFIVVRFGNVIGSQGSVFTIFEKQIKQRRPITITHPKMERYFMSIVEACRLVLEAAAMGEGGCTFLLDMGEPIQILEMAKQMIKLSGLQPEVDVPIIFSELRPGEKLTEELWYDTEKRMETANPKIYKVTGNGQLPENFQELAAGIIEDARALAYDAMIQKIRTLVPQYVQTAPPLLPSAMNRQRVC